MTVALRTDERALIAVCLLALALRPVGWSASLVTVGVGGVGALAAIEPASRPRALGWLLAVGLGAAAFALVRVHSLAPPLRMTMLGVAATVLAALAEELFFRRFVYARLVRFGAPVAIAGSAVTFAVVHVPAYGARSLPIDVAAGLVFGWQRWSTATWTAPAVTHVVANLVQVW